MQRLVDLAVGAVASVVAVPVVAIAALGVKLSSPGPVFFRARRMGRGAEPFTILKIRTMRVTEPGASAVTAAGDDRIFPFGKVLRACKVDELPQLWNVFVGDMAIVGPRPEAVSIVEQHYAPEHRRTLDVRPGLASWGSLWSSTHGEALIGRDDPERDYLEKVLPIKLALELHYVDHRSPAADLRIVARTVSLILAQVAGSAASVPEPPHLEEAVRRYRYEPTLDTGEGVDTGG